MASRFGSRRAGNARPACRGPAPNAHRRAGAPPFPGRRRRKQCCVAWLDLQEGLQQLHRLLGRRELAGKEHDPCRGRQSEAKAQPLGFISVRGSAWVKKLLVHRMRGEDQLACGHAECLEIPAVGRADVEESRELREEGPKQDSHRERRRWPSQEVRVPPEEDRYPGKPRPGGRAQVARPVVSEEKQGLRLPGAQARDKARVVETKEALRSGIGGPVRHELGFVSGEKVDVPLDALPEPLVVSRGDPKVPQVEHAKLDIRVLAHPPEPRAVVLGGVGEHHRKAPVRVGIADHGCFRSRPAALSKHCASRCVMLSAV
jgi:hypothetical protein